jgi:O-antigen/teichoic acid export membrane protein
MVATAVVGIASTPLLLKWLGTERFAAYKVLSDWCAYLPLVDLGLGGSLAALLTAAVARGDRDQAGELMIAGLRIYALIVPSLATILLGCAYVVPQVAPLAGLPAHELKAAILISTIFVFWLPAGVFRSLAESQQLSYMVNLLLTLQGLITTGLLLIAARAGWGLPGQSLATVAGQAPMVFVLYRRAVVEFPRIFATVPKASTSRMLWSLNWPSFLVTLSNRVGLFSDSIILAWLLGPVAVAAFFFTQRLAMIVQTQLQGIASATWTGLVEIQIKHSSRLFEERLLELTTFTSAIGIALLGPLHAYNQRFIQLWVGPSFYAGHAVSGFACINMWLWSVFALWTAIITGTGQMRRWMPYSLTAGLINLAVSIAATKTFGLSGPLIGTFVSFLAVQVWAFPRLFDIAFGISGRQLWASVLKPLVVGLPYVVILWYLARLPAGRSWALLLLQMGAAISGGLALWWIFSLNAHSRLLWKSRVSHAFSR